MSKILIVEDEAVLQKALADMLTEYNYDIVQATDGEEGLAKARETKPDLILLDLVLPKKHGLDVLEELSKDPTVKEIPVMILTNLEDKDDISRALELGAKQYLVKANYDMQEVIEKVEQCLNAGK